MTASDGHGAAEVGEVDGDARRRAACGRSTGRAAARSASAIRSDAAGQRDVLEQPRRDAVGPGQLAGSVSQRDRLARRGPSGAVGRAAAARRDHGVSRAGRRRAARSTREREEDRRDRARPGSRSGSAAVALEDEEAEAAEPVAEDPGDRHEADRRDAGEPEPGHDQRHRQRQLDAPAAAARAGSPSVRRLEDVARDRVEARRRCCGRRSAACTGRAGSRRSAARAR